MVLNKFWLFLVKFYFWKEDWTLGCFLLRFWSFLDILIFYKIQNFILFGNSWGNAYIKFLVLPYFSSASDESFCPIDLITLKFCKVSSFLKLSCGYKRKLLFWVYYVLKSLFLIIISVVVISLIMNSTYNVLISADLLNTTILSWDTCFNLNFKAKTPHSQLTSFLPSYYYSLKNIFTFSKAKIRFDLNSNCWYQFRSSELMFEFLSLSLYWVVISQIYL